VRNCPLSHIPGSFHDVERDEFCQDRLGSNVKETQKHGGDSHTDHPCMDMAKGERLLKDLYEALRAGKGWDKTLFMVLPISSESFNLPLYVGPIMT
jgi:hypothetical protein